MPQAAIIPSGGQIFFSIKDISMACPCCDIFYSGPETALRCLAVLLTMVLSPLQIYLSFSSLSHSCGMVSASGVSWRVIADWPALPDWQSVKKSGRACPAQLSLDDGFLYCCGSASSALLAIAGRLSQGVSPVLPGSVEFVQQSAVGCHILDRGSIIAQQV